MPNLSQLSWAISPRSIRHSRYARASFRHLLVTRSFSSRHLSYAIANALHSAKWSKGKLPFAGGFGAKAAPDSFVDVVMYASVLDTDRYRDGPGFVFRKPAVDSCVASCVAAVICLRDRSRNCAGAIVYRRFPRYLNSKRERGRFALLLCVPPPL